jgi:hypothetical protein
MLATKGLTEAGGCKRTIVFGIDFSYYTRTNSISQNTLFFSFGYFF